MKIQFFIFLFFIFSLASAQDTNTLSKEKKIPSQKDTSLPDHFRSVSLLMNYSDTFNLLKKDALILVKNSDFDEFDEENPHWIIGKLPPLIPYLYYHFYKDQLYVISLFFSKTRTSYIELYKKLKKKYGFPSTSSPHQSTWEIENIKIILDSLPSVKYIYKPILEKIAKNHNKNPSQKLSTNEHELENKILDAL